MGFFSSPASTPAKPAPEPDPELVVQREAAKAAANADNADVSEKARRRYAGRTMGTSGANATYTDTAAGFGKTLGSANI